MAPEYSIRALNAMQHNTHTPFYELPTEVRIEMYQYVFDNLNIDATRYGEWME